MKRAAVNAELPKPCLAAALSRDNVFKNSTLLRSSKRRKIFNESRWQPTPPEMPFLYLKEVTSVVVFNDNPQCIADRITEAAKSLSCVGEYNNDEAKATLLVDNTEFLIRLFRVKTENAKEIIIVEMQRLNGSSIVFHTVARTILKISKSKPSTSAPLNTKSTPQSPPSRIKTKTSGTLQSASDGDLFTCTMGIVDSLLKKDRIDANLLGMESLQLLTNTSSSSDSMVSHASDVVLNGKYFTEVKKRVYSLVMNEADDVTATSGSDSDDESSSANSTIIATSFDDRCYQKMRICAFSALSNALEVKANELESCLIMEEWTKENGILSILLLQMSHDEFHPHESHLSAKCLLTAVKNSDILRSRAISLNALNVVRAGAVHNLLGPICDDLLEYLGNTK